MGAFGVALLCQEIMRKKGEKTKFFGLDLAEREIKLTNKECELCQNHCRITYAHIKGLDIVPSWGYMCGREPDEEKVRHRKGFELYRLRERLLNTTGKLGLASQDSPVIALPRILTMYTYLPMWESFFSLLGFRTKLSKITGEKEKEIGAELSGADFCFPIKAAHGHVYQLIMDPKIDFVFLPYMISETLKQETTGEHFCPYVQSFPGAMKSALNLNKIDCFKLLSPVIDFRWSETRFLEELAKYLCPILGLTPLMVYEAFRKARKIQKKFLKECEQKGKNALEELKKENKKGIVIIGRPYNTYDLGLCINLPQRIADLGYTIVPLDFIPVSQQKIGDEFRNMYWNYGQKIIKALKYIREEDTLFAVYFTNFSCGPDSFILNYAERIMKDKPMLIIELDEHGADAGYITRIEAFSDVIKEYKPKKSCFTFRYPSVASSELKGRKIWIPPMHPIGSRLFASAFKGYGYEAEALPQEDRDAFELGRSLTRGSECLPTSVTLGALVKKIKEEDGKPQNYAFFMPTAEGPCRFGQYAFLHRIILDELGLKDMIIISPASYNAYQGLPEELRKMLWIGILLGDIIFKFGCKIRPYENIPGTTEQTIEESIRLLEEGFSKKKDIKLLLSKIRAQFEAIPRTREPKPLVGIVGEIYVRCDPFSNEEVVKRIEMYGAEAWLVPVSEWILYTVYSQRWKKYWKKPSAKQGILSRLRSYLKNLYVLTQEHEWYKEAGKLLEDRREPPMGKIIEMGLKYMPVNFEGEAVLTIGRAILFAHSGASLIVNAAPFGCMPGTYSTAIFQEVQETIGVPCVNMFYDGEGGLNDKLETFIANIKNIHR
jgi:predicted nucleotide-binding protein (sugar kinase/HSP70/actin superfamily)